MKQFTVILTAEEIAYILDALEIAQDGASDRLALKYQETYTKLNAVGEDSLVRKGVQCETPKI